MKQLGAKIKNLYLKHTSLTIVLIISIIIVVFYLATLNVPEVFPGGGQILNIACQLSIGYIINYLFFYINVYSPKYDNEQKAFSSTELLIASLLEEIRTIENFFESFITLNYGNIRFPLGTIYYKNISTGARDFIDITKYLKTEYRNCQRCFEKIINNRYFYSLDDTIIELINDLQYSDFLGYMQRFQQVNEDFNRTMFAHNRYTSVLADSYVNFLDTAAQLTQKCNLSISSKKSYAILQDDELDEYLVFIKEKRELTKNSIVYGKYYIENSRVL